MCGRYSQTTTIEAIKERFSFDNIEGDLSPRYNIAPGQYAFVLVGGDEKNLVQMKWGLVPVWAKDKNIGYKMINARSETLAEKKTFKRLLPSHRCLVLTDGFYEWKKPATGKKKIPMRFTMKNDSPFAFAGLWDHWESDDGEIINSFTIITTEANDIVRPVHDRMPVILNPDDESIWIDRANKDTEKLLALLQPFPSDEMTGYEVSTIVNSPANDTPECITPVNA